MKKVIIMLSILLLLVASVRMVWATEPAQVRDEALVQEARQLYKQCLYSSGRESFYGMCGLMTSYQLWRLGVNESLEVHDGNKQFDAYKNLQVTTGGHNVKAYSAEEYSLLEALNVITQNGTRPARNVLVGFQWTSTEAGARYGHACVINAIEDGIVYFTESFDYAMGKLEGQVITCSVEEFVDFFDGWTKYEGCIDFGTKQYANACDSYGTDLFVQLRFESSLRSQPCLIGQNDCRRLRSLTAGELLHATGVYTSGDGDLFYRIDDGGVTGYVSANAVHLQKINEQGVYLKNAGIPLSIEPGKDPSLSGKVVAENSQLTRLLLEIIDAAGTVVLQSQVDIQGAEWDLDQLNDQLALDTLAAGSYTVTFSAEVTYALADQMQLSTQKIYQTLFSQTLQVGGDVPQSPEEVIETIPDGWVFADGAWYCYENGQPCTGWVTRIGVEYYLQPDGAVTTGWYKTEAWTHYFSSTGALCQGWVTTPEGTYYWISDGVMAQGLQQIEGEYYWFGTDGRLWTDGTITVEDVCYHIESNGVAVPVA